MEDNTTYYAKYLKYKEKYLNLKNSLEGGKGSYGSRNRRSGYYPTYSSNPSAQITIKKAKSTSPKKPEQSSSPKPEQSSSPKPEQSSTPKPSVTEEDIKLYKEAFPKLMSNFGSGHCNSKFKKEDIDSFNNMKLADVAKKLPSDLKSIADKRASVFPTFGDIRSATKSLDCPGNTSGSSSNSGSSWLPSTSSVVDSIILGR